MAKHQSPLENRVKHANRMVEYYESFLSSGHSFRLGLYMAKQWLKYLTESQYDLNEIRLFLSALEGGADMHGSGWLDLTLGVQEWIAEIEDASETG